MYVHIASKVLRGKTSEAEKTKLCQKNRSYGRVGDGIERLSHRFYPARKCIKAHNFFFPLPTFSRRRRPLFGGGIHLFAARSKLETFILAKK